MNDSSAVQRNLAIAVEIDEQFGWIPGTLLVSPGAMLLTADRRPGLLKIVLSEESPRFRYLHRLWALIRRGTAECSRRCVKWESEGRCLTVSPHSPFSEDIRLRLADDVAVTFEGIMELWLSDADAASDATASGGA